MERRGFIKYGIMGIVAGVLAVTSGCGRKPESAPGLVNQEKLWQAATAEKVNEPVELTYAKNTPALYKDASFAKEDANFTPKVGGG